MKKNLAVLASVVVVVLGCAPARQPSATSTHRSGPQSSLNAPPTPAQLAAADYGSAPPREHQEQTRAAMRELLKDPQSARYRFRAPERGWLPRHHFEPVVRHGQVFGWKVHFAVNAKNSYGGYTGDRLYEAFFHHGRLRAILQQGRYKDIFGYAMWDVIAKVGPAGT